MSFPYTIEPLEKRHDRNAFDCGEESLNDFLKRFARQNEDKRLSRTFVAVPPGDVSVYGYYSLSVSHISFEHLPEEVRRKLPRYPVPVSHLGRLAVDRKAKGHGLGEFLLMDAFRRTILAAKELGIFAVEVVALSDPARQFYLKYGFRELTDDRYHLYLPIKTIEALRLTE